MDTIQQPLVQALSKALVHFLWQGAALALVTSLAIRVFRPPAPIRYALGVLCLATMATAPLVTTGMLMRTPGVAPVSAVSAVAVTADPGVSGVATSTEPVMSSVMSLDGGSRVGATLVGLWLAGVLVLSVRLVGGWMLARRLVARAHGLAAPEIRALASRVADRLALARAVEVLESSTISVPMMIGWIAPVVILPAAAMAALTPTQVEALLAHELAHVRRHDYLVNLLQSVVETVLFYHPAVWWISRDVREAREHCCDDLAVAVCDRVVYASALADPCGHESHAAIRAGGH